MILTALIAAAGLVGVWLLLAAVRRLRARRVLSAVTGGLSGAALLLGAALAAVIGIGLQGYRRLTAEQPAAQLRFTALGPRDFDALLTYPDGHHDPFELRGDEWQVDARVITWRPLATLLGFDTAYRLERISGRYTRVEDERTLPRTVYALHGAGAVDLWELLRRYRDRLPWIDARYGSAAYLPMADGASYAISVSPSGLVARPLNQAAREAVSGWR